jgi:hypothetical protein
LPRLKERPSLAAGVHTTSHSNQPPGENRGRAAKTETGDNVQAAALKGEANPPQRRRVTLRSSIFEGHVSATTEAEAEYERAIIESASVTGNRVRSASTESWSGSQGDESESRGLSKTSMQVVAEEKDWEDDAREKPGGLEHYMWQDGAIRTEYESLFVSIELPVRFCCQWEVPAVLRSQSSEQFSAEDLPAVMVITGSGPELEANSCGAYIEREWPDIGTGLLRCVIHSLSSSGSPGLYSRCGTPAMVQGND